MTDPATSEPPPAVTAKAHWRQTRLLMWACLALWFLFAFVIHAFAPALNTKELIGFPLGYYMAAQGAMIVFAAVVFWYAAYQTRIDRRHGVDE